NWLQWFVNINPISHLVSAVRELTNNGMIGFEFIISLVSAAVIVAIFAPLTVRAYMRRT
ncbi:ABC transporter permease, partial [Bacillus sp. SIMBA_069]